MTSTMPITSASEWKQERAGKVITLPSGKTARVRSVSSALLFRSPSIPETLVRYVTEALNGNTKNLDRVINQDKLTVDEYRMLNDFLDWYTVECFVDPPVVNGDKAPGANEIHALDVPYEDKVYLMNFIDQPLHALRSFRSEQDGNVEPVDVAASDEPAGEPAPEVA